MRRTIALAMLAAGCGGAAVAPAPPPPRCPAVAPQAAASAPPSPAPAAAGLPGVDAAKDRVVAAINAQDGAALFSMFDPGMQSVLPRDKADGFVSGVVAARGKLVDAKREGDGGSAVEGAYRVKAERGEWELRLHLDDKGRIDGMVIRDPPAAEPPVAKSTILLRLPFHGRWVVMWGGDNAKDNQHVVAKSQRRAADLVVVGADGKTYTGDGTKNADYHAYGQPIVAVADGTVVTVVDGVPENVPDQMNDYFLPGNVVVIQHQPALYSVYAHLQPGKIRVKPGARVKAGAVLGLCGNSGNSSEPHLHFQLEDGPSLAHSYGVEAVFPSALVTRGGEKAERKDYAFLKGDIIDAP